MRQSVSDSVTSTVRDLYESGLIDEKTLKNVQSLCLPEIREYSPESIVKIRKKLKLSRDALAGLFNVSPSTVQNWEKGYKVNYKNEYTIIPFTILAWLFNSSVDIF